MPPQIGQKNAKRYLTTYYTQLVASYSNLSRRFNMYICEKCVESRQYKPEWINGIVKTNAIKKTHGAQCDFCHKTLPIEEE